MPVGAAVGGGGGDPGNAAAAVAAAAAAAVAKQPRNVVYPEYKTDDDFPRWLSGYVSRVRATYGFKLDERVKLEEEVVRSISGKLAVGSALDTYNRLEAADKTSFQRLVTRLTEEFTDPRAKKKFNACMHYNIRKKNQPLKEYMQAIVKDMDRYSYTPATIVTVSGGVVPNPERETQGVRRFIEGIRNERGKTDEDFKRHLEYHLQDEREMNWTNAIKVASRYETVYDATGDDEDSDSDSDSDSDEDVKAVDIGKKKKKGKGKATISALADQVHENQIRITKMETAQERMATAQDQLSAAQNTTNATLQEISAKLDLSLATGQNSYRNQFTYQPRFQQQSFRYQQPRSQQQQLYLQQQQRARSFQQPRPQTYTFQPRGGAAFRANPAQNTWGGRTDQARQGNFGFNRRTPASFPAATPTPTAPKAPAATVAAVEETDIAAEELGDYAAEEEEQVVLSMSQFMSLASQAGVEVPEEGFIPAVEELNFC